MATMPPTSATIRSEEFPNRKGYASSIIVREAPARRRAEGGCREWERDERTSATCDDRLRRESDVVNCCPTSGPESGFPASNLA